MPPEITDPTPAPDAFRELTDAAAQSQAALLLLLGRRLRADDSSARARLLSARSAALADTLPEEDLARFPVPDIEHTGERISAERAEARLVESFLRGRVARREEQLASGEFWHGLASRLYEERTALAVAVLMEACLRHPNELVRVAAASSYFDLSDQPSRMLEVLVRGTYSYDELVRDLAATALARVAPEHPRLFDLTKPAPLAGGEPTRTSLLVHGTYARNASWWQPLGDFHLYLAAVRPDLYGAADQFSWSGGYSDAARALAAVELQNWAGARNLAGLDLFTHSHGGSACMLASQAGMSIGKLVLLSCPVHFPKYMPRFDRIAGGVVSVRVHLDLVILADGGGQRFNHPQIRENVLPVWFNHSATHDRATWQRHNVPAML